MTSTDKDIHLRGFAHGDDLRVRKVEGLYPEGGVGVGNVHLKEPDFRGSSHGGNHEVRENN